MEIITGGGILLLLAILAIGKFFIWLQELIEKANRRK